MSFRAELESQLARAVTAGAAFVVLGMAYRQFHKLQNPSDSTL